MSPYDQEILTALYRALDYMMCEDLPCGDVKNAIMRIESKYED